MMMYDNPHIICANPFCRAMVSMEEEGFDTCEGCGLAFCDLTCMGATDDAVVHNDDPQSCVICRHEVFTYTEQFDRMLLTLNLTQQQLNQKMVQEWRKLHG